MISPANFYILASLLLAIGLLGLIFRRNLISVFFSLEIILNSANVILVGFSQKMGNVNGQVFVFFILAVAAAEAAVGLAIVVSLFRLRKTIDIEEFSKLRW
jgi:NADH-quinone oxidoreductase subunit K